MIHTKVLVETGCYCRHHAFPVHERPPITSMRSGSACSAARLSMRVGKSAAGPNPGPTGKETVLLGRTLAPGKPPSHSGFAVWRPARMGAGEDANRERLRNDKPECQVTLSP